jgi:hypothetical protein
MKEEFLDIWQLQDEVRTCVDACARCGIWDLSYDRYNQVLRLELDSHLDDEQCDDLCSQFPTSGSYEGEGQHGSQFTIQTR